MATPQAVIDTEPLIAYLYDEPGASTVATIIENAETAIATVIASELLYKVARLEGEAGQPTPDSLLAAERDIRALTRLGVAIEPAPWRLAGEIKAHGGLSLADAHAVALAVDRDVKLLVGADEDFADLPVDVTIERIREEGV